MTVAEIVREYLEREGFDGLCGHDCSCPKDGFDFMCAAHHKCSPGYRWECEGCEEDCAGNDECGCYRPERQVRE